MKSNKKISVDIKSAKQFMLTVGNAYAPTWVAVAGSPQKHQVEEQADCLSQTFPVHKIRQAANTQYDDYYFRGSFYPIPGYTFFEDPFIPESLDPKKKLNYHFKKSRMGDPVPLEYMVWRFCHTHSHQIMEGIFSIIVTKDNFAVIQWLLQALYNDTQLDYCSLDKSMVSRLHSKLSGERQLIKMPNKVVDSTVGEFDLLASNSEFLEETIKKQEAEIALKRQMLDEVKALAGKSGKTSAVMTATVSTTTPELVEAQARNLQIAATVAETVTDSDNPDEILQRALDAGIIIEAGPWFKYKETTLGRGKSTAINKLMIDSGLREEVKKALLSLSPALV